MNPSATARMLSQLWLITIAVLAVSVLFLAKVLLLPLGIAILFAFLLAPVVASLERLRFPRPIAALLVIFAFAALLCVITWSLFTQFIAIVNDLPSYRDNIAQKMQALHSPSNSAFGRAQRELESISDDLGIANSTATGALQAPSHSDDKPIGTSPERPVQVREVGRPTGRLDQLGGIVEPLATALLSVVFTFFVLLQREDLRNRLIRLSGDRNLSLMTQAMNDASRRITRYFLLQVSVNLTYGAIVCGALYFIGLPHFVLFGALAVLCRFVPYVGAPIAALTPTLLSLAVFPGWRHAAYIFGVFVILEIVTANYIEPRIYGKHTGLSSLAVLIAAAFWTLIWGPVGLILSVPLTVCLVVMGSHIPMLEFLAVLLGDQPVIPPYTSFYQRLLAHDEREAANILDTALRDQPLVTVYDSILLPALTLVEMERQRGDLEESTVGFIRNSTAEMVDELGFRALESNTENPAIQNAAPAAANTSATLDADNAQQRADSLPRDRGLLGEPLPHASDPANEATSAANPAPPVSILVIPVRDGSDNLVSTMLTQVLSLAGFQATSIPVLPIDRTIAAVTEQKPSIVFLSGMPPVAMARAHRLYRSLRAINGRGPQPQIQHPGTDHSLKIIIGIWNYSEDPARPAQMISRTEDLHVSTTLADAIAEARAHVEPRPAVAEPLDASPQLITTPTDTAA